MYKVAVGVFALFIGLLVYVFLEGMDHITAKTSGALHEVQFISDQALRKKAEHQAEVRLGLRVTTLVVWICYLVFFGRIIVPSCILLTRPDSAPYLLAWHNIISFFAGFVILTVALHVHVICMRLLVLRPRLFGGENVVVGRGGHEE